MADAADNPLLTYFANTDSGTFQPGQPGYITLVVAPGPTDKVQCDTIVLAVPYGGGSDIFLTKPVLQNPSSSDWTYTDSIAPDGTPIAVITLQNQVAETLVNNTFSLQLAGTINQFTGTCEIDITESSAVYVEGTDRPAYTNKTGILAVQGAPTAPLAITAFLAQAPTDQEAGAAASPLVPVTQFMGGAPIRLVWSATSATSYELYQGNTKCQVATGATEYLVENGILEATTFTLIAHGAEQTVVNTLTITIINPSIQALTVREMTTLGSSTDGKVLTVYGSSDFTGQLAASAGLTVTNAFVANNDVTIGGAVKGDLEIEGSTTVDQNFTVKKDTYTQSAIVQGDLTVKAKGGKTQLGTFTVSEGTELVCANCFPAGYKFFEMILSDLAPSALFGVLQAQFYPVKAPDKNQVPISDSIYNGNIYANTNGGDDYTVYSQHDHLDLTNTKSTDYKASQEHGVSGILTFPNMNTGKQPCFTGQVYTPYAYYSQPDKPVGCLTFVGGSINKTETITGMRFYFDGTNKITGTVTVFGWN